MTDKVSITKIKPIRMSGKIASVIMAMTPSVAPSAIAPVSPM